MLPYIMRRAHSTVMALPTQITCMSHKKAVLFVTQIIPSSSPWRGSLRDLASMVNAIRRSWAFGRLTLRSTTHVGVAHLYFHGGKVVHIVSNSGDASKTLADLRHWTQAIVRFERGIATSSQNVSSEHERMFDELLLQLQRRNGVPTLSPEGQRMTPSSESLAPTRAYPPPTQPRATTSRMTPPSERPEGQRVAPRPQSQRVVDSHIIEAPGVEQLITPMEWRILVEGIRRASLAVAQLVGPQEAMSVLRDILDDFSSAFPALSCLQLVPGGYLQVVRTAQLDRIPRLEVIKGFAALIATCRYFCAPIIGEENARRLIMQALNGIGPALASLGVFDV